MTTTCPPDVLRAASLIASHTTSFSANEILKSRIALMDALAVARRRLKDQKIPTTHSRWIELGCAANAVEEWHDQAN